MQRFLEQVRTDAFDLANNPDDGGLRLAALVRVILDRLGETGILDNGQVAYYHQETPNLYAEVHGYSCDTDDDVLALYYLVDAQEMSALGDQWTVQPVGKDAIEKGFRRLLGFVKMARAGRLDNLEESQPAAELAELVRDSAQNGLVVELHVLTLGTVSDRAAVFAAKDEFSREVWDLTRLTRTCGIGGDEHVSVDFVGEFGQSLPCLVTPKASDGIQVLMACIPGKMLADIYNTYRGRLLERNVRSFLQFTGKVNKGIRETILASPERFLPYNNGLSATASAVDLEEIAGGLAKIRAVRDLQIVNGGQTTASVASCLRRDGADLCSVLIPLKLSIVPAEKVDELVPLISKSANTQNRIQEADFSANHPWHIELEKLSRATWTQPTSASPRGTRWFYERSRGQYADEVGAQATPAGRRRFRAENPSVHKITKTDLAKYVLSWDQRPAVVSRGAQKCFMEFMNQICRESRPKPDTEEFRRIVGQAILFHTAERLYGELKFQGYRANVVTYAIARLSHVLQRRMCWDAIWEQQSLPEDLIAPLKAILIGVRDIILHPPANRNITEWCKRDECWLSVLRLNLELPGLADAGHGSNADRPAPTAEEGVMIEAVKGVPADVWFAASKWAKETQSLEAWQRGIAYSIGGLLARALTPSPKQARQACRLLLDARRLGFGHDRLTPDVLEKVGTAVNGS